MAYTKNLDPWTSASVITTAIMDNFETIYTQTESYLISHNHDALYPTKVEMEATFWYAGNDGSESGSDADLLYKSGGNLHAADFEGMGVSAGLIILWYGSIVSIPAGWHLCDGTDGTIDLCDRFTICSSDDLAPGTTGGATTFTMTGTITVNTHSVTVAEMGSHRHPFNDKYSGGVYGWNNLGGSSSAYTNLDYINDNTESAGSGTAHGHSAGEGTHLDGDGVAIMPRYYALAYIQKI